MSAESPLHAFKSGSNVVRPQPYSDKTVMESFVDYIQDAYSQNSGPKLEEREKVQWLKFERADINDTTFNPDCYGEDTVPLLIVLGFKNGVQVWNVAGNGEAQEVLSLRQGPVKILTFLPQPETVAEFQTRDCFVDKRPLVAMCDASSAGEPFCCVKMVSLKYGDEVHKIPLRTPVVDVKANHRVLVVALKERLVVHDACQFKQLFIVTSCYPCPGPHENPFALGARWLAYAEKRLVAVHQSGGGMSGDGSQSYAATVISAAKTVKKGLSRLGQTVASSITGSRTVPAQSRVDATHTPSDGDCRPGIVTVIDMQAVRTSQVSLRDDSEGEGLVAHFPAHAAEPIYALEFDPSGLMLATADKLGHNFHVFRVMAHPNSCSLGAVHHLYTLYRGDTTAKVEDMSFTLESRWVAVSTVRGTTHVFPITPYGGSVNVRTHVSTRVVNRQSRFHRSAGIDEIPHPKSARDGSPVHGSPSSSPRLPEQHRYLNAANNHMGNPRLPPFPHPTTVQPLMQIKQTVGIPGINTTVASGSTQPQSTSGTVPESLCLASCFARSRGWVSGCPPRDKDKRYVDSLYTLNHTGMLVEHVLEPQARSGSERVTDNCPLELAHTPRAQWLLGRTPSSTELRPPLRNNSPLLIAHQAVVTKTPTESTLTRQESRESLTSDHSSQCDPEDEWLSQVEILTHMGPARRLWMGPQFSFKTIQGGGSLPASSSSVLPSLVPDTTPAIDMSEEVQLKSLKGAFFSNRDHLGGRGSLRASSSSVLPSLVPDTTPAIDMSEEVQLKSLNLSPGRSSPVEMPGCGSRSRGASSRHASCSDGSQGVQSSVPHMYSIEAGSYESPSLDAQLSGHWAEATQQHVVESHVGDTELQQSLAEAMCEAPAAKGRANRHSLEIGSMENLSTSSGSASSAPRPLLFEGGPQTMDTQLMFPSNSDSTDTSQ